MKGQMYILAALVVLLVIVSIKFSAISIKESPDVEKSFLDFRSEIFKASELSMLSDSSKAKIKENTDEFLLLSKNLYVSQGFDVKFLYSYAHNGSGVFLANYLGENLTNVNIALVSSTVQLQHYPLIENGKTVYNEFSPVSGTFSVVVISDSKKFNYSGAFGDDSTLSEHLDIYFGYDKTFFKEEFSKSAIMFR